MPKNNYPFLEVFVAAFLGALYFASFWVLGFILAFVLAFFFNLSLEDVSLAFSVLSFTLATARLIFVSYCTKKLLS